MRHVRIVVQGQTVWIQRQHLLHRGLHARQSLVRQAINHVDADGFKARISGGIHHRLGFFYALNAVDSGLYLRVEILYAHTHAVETQFAQTVNRVGTDFAWVDFNRVFAARTEFKMAFDVGKYPSQLLIVQKRRRTAAKMQLRQLVLALQMRRNQIQLAPQIIDVFVGP